MIITMHIPCVGFIVGTGVTFGVVVLIGECTLVAEASIRLVIELVNNFVEVMRMIFEDEGDGGNAIVDDIVSVVMEIELWPAYTIDQDIESIQ